MGIFLNIDKSRLKRLNEFEDENGNNETEEVEDDNYTEGEDNEETEAEDTGTTDTEDNTDTEGEDTGDAGETEDGEGNENTEAEDIGAGEENNDIEDGGYSEEDDNAEDDEYRIDNDEDNTGAEDIGAGEENNDIEDGGYSEEDDNAEDTGQDTGDEEESTDDADSSPDDSKLKQLEGELFDQLSDEQKKIKINELKKCFEEMHTRCDGIIKMVTNVTAPDEESSKIFEYLNDNLTDLKQYIYDYFTYTFDTKSYLENSAQYHKYIAVLNSLNSILETLIKKKESKSK